MLVESHDGRPTKIEGNPQHPCSLGSTDAHAQASILDLYSPDRVMSDKYPGVMEGKSPRKWEDFDRFARGEAEKLAKDKGKGFYILTEQAPSPAVRELRKAMQEKLPNASWHSYEPTDTSEALKGAEAAFGAKLVVRYRFDKAERILALDSDFLGTDADSVFHSRAFAAKRNDAAHMNRLYVVESTYTVTGTMADHRLRVPASQISDYLLAIARELHTVHAAKYKAIGAVVLSGMREFPGEVGESGRERPRRARGQEPDRRRAAAAGVGSRAGARRQRRARQLRNRHGRVPRPAGRTARQEPDGTRHGHGATGR